MTDKERHEDETLKNCIQEAYGCSDDQLLAELAEIDKTLSESDFPGVEDRIMSRLKARMVEEEAEKEVEVDSDSEVSVAQVEAPGSDTEAAPCTEVPEKKVVRIGKKKIALVAVLVAAFVGVLGVSASGGKIYFLKSREKEQGIVVNSGKNVREVSSIEEAYKEIEKSLGISALKMNYIPVDMKFKEMSIKSNKAILSFDYQEETVYFIQIKGSTEISIGINSDREDNGKSIYNKWLGKDLCIEEEVLDDGKIGYSVVASEKDAYYRIVGKISEEELKKIIEKLSY